MAHILLITHSERLEVDGECLLVRTETEEKAIHFSDVEAVIINSIRLSITTKTILKLADYSVPLIFCNEKYQPEVFCTSPYTFSKLTKRIYEQIEWTEERKVQLWKIIINRKVENQKRTLEFFCKEESIIEKLKEKLVRVESVPSKDEVSELEAISARIYFKELFDHDFTRRKDSIENAALNFGYTIVRNYIANILVAKGLHPSISICHRSELNNYNLVDDIHEIYRVITDFTVVKESMHYESFENDYKNKLIETLHSEFYINGKKVSFKTSIEILIDNLLKYMKYEIEIMDCPLFTGVFNEQSVYSNAIL